MTLKRISLYILLFVSALTLSAHRFPYPTRIVDGQEMYEYPVQKGEGLYRISVTFGVSQEELIRYNPELSTNGLKLGQTILVPVKETHVVQKGETLYRIAKKHGLTVEQLKELNPEVSESSLPIGGVLRLEREKRAQPLPARAELKAPKAEAEPEDTLLRPAATFPNLGEELSDRSDASEVPEAEAKPEDTLLRPAATSPNLGEELSDRSDKSDASEAPEKPETAEVADEFFPGEESEEMPALFVAGDTFRLALLLPLQADAQIYDLKMERFLRFYEGILLALREQKRSDVKIEVHVYDVGKTEYKLRKALEAPEMQRINAIIGPAYSEQVPEASRFAKAHRVPCLLPFTNDVDSLESNPYLLQNNPDVEEGTKVVQFKREKDDEWAEFDGLMRTYFNVLTPSTSRPRYDILGYDLAMYFIPAALRAVSAQNGEEWQNAFLSEYDGLQSTLAFRRVGEGGFMNTPLRVIKKAIEPEETTNQEETE